MTRRCTWFGNALLPVFVREVEQDRLLGGSGASVQLDDRFRLLVLLLRPSRGAPTALLPGGSIDLPRL
jgi:hypothetical protein